MAQAFPSFEEWKQQKREAEDRKYRAYEDNFRAYQAGEAVDLGKIEGGFSQADFDGWKQWHEQNKDRLDVEYTVKALDEDLVDAVRGQYQAQWGSKYYYDLFDPEDAARAAGGQMPKYLDGTYDLDNPYDRWLYDNGLPNRADFYDMYSQAAYDRQERWEENTSLLKGIEKDWNTVYDQKEAFQNAYNAALDETAQQSGRAPTQAEREALAQELLMSGKYDDIAAAYSALPDVRQEPDTLEAYVDRLEQPDYSAYDAMLQAMQDGTAVDDAFFDAYRQSDYDKWFSGQIAFTQQQLDDAYEQYLTDKQQQALKAQLRPGQEAASEIDKLLADGKAAEAETKIDDAVAALDERLAGFEQADKLWERYRSAAIRNAASVPATDALIPSTPAREADLTGAIDDLQAELQKEPERYGMNAADVATFVSLLRQRTLLQTQGRAAVSAVQAQAQQQERQDAIEREAQRINEKYAALDEEKEFESKSAQSDAVLAALEDPYQQNMYRAVNRIMDEGYNPIYGNWGVVAKGEPVMLSMWIHEGLTDEERARYNYLVATKGGAAGEQYIKDLKPQLQRRYAEVTDERQRQTAKELPVLSSLASVYMQFPAAAEGAIALAGTLGDEDYVAEHPELFSGTRLIQNVRESVAEGMSPTGQFFYQTGMSILDNVARLPLGKAGLGVMGGAVLSSTVNDYVAKGYSGGDALMMGVGSAAIEVLTEKISLDNLMRILKGGATRLSRSALQQAVKEAFQQSIYEGSEEMASEILNYFWESAVLDDGEYDQAVARYEAMGLTKNQAVSQALKDKLPDVLLSGAGGFLSGLVMGGGGSLIAEWRSDTAAGDGFGGNAVQQAQAGREIRLAYQEAVKEDGRVLGDEAARQLKDDLQTLGVAKETARTVLQGVDMPNAWASDGLRTAMESVSETARSEAARVEARAARTEAAELKSSQRLGTLMEKFTAAQEKANAARAQNDLKGYLAAVEDMRGAVLNYQNALAVEEKAGEARQIETQEQTRKATAATERAVADAQPAVQEGYARVAAEIATQRAAAEQFGAQQAAGQAQNAAGQAEAGPDQRTVTGQGDTGRGSDAPASTAKGAAQVDVMDELVRGAGTAVSAQETEGTGARARSVMEEVLAGTEEPGARPAGQGRRRYRAGVNRADTAGRLDASDRIQLRVLDGLGKKYGVKIVIEDTIRYEDGEGRVYAGTANAYYDRSDGTIHVALDAEGGAYLFFAVHELTHKLRAENANAYAALEAFVLNKLEASELYGALTQGEGGTLEERIASVRALYAARGLELSRGEALEELVCDAIPVILTDEQTVRELVRTDRTLAERIRDFFEEFYNELMRQLAGVVYGPGNRVEAAALMNDTETVRELAELFKTALESSADLQYELLTQSGSAIEEAENDKKRGRRLSARADGEDAITMEDVAAIQSIGRKSVNAFSSDEIRTAEPFARRYWRELGVKSPFFRAWFGDWRANDRTPVQLVRVAGADAPKSGRAINADTGRPISWGDRLRSETWAHGTKNALESIKGIDRIIETAVLLDTIAANQTGKSKLPGTAFMHSLYSLVDDGSGLTLYRLFAEEAVPVGGGDPFTRAYELKEIKKVATAPYGVLSVSGGLTNGAPATTYTIADLFAFVKENVPDFQPKPVHPAMLNADGTPRAVRQGVDATVEVLDGKTALQDGEAVYVKLENPYPAGTAAEVPGRAALEAGGYDGAVYQGGDGGTYYAVLDGTQLKSATDNAGTFDGRNPNLRFSQKADAEGGSAPGRIYDYSKPFAEQVDDWMAGQTPQYDTLLIGRTPLLYRQIGLSDVPMTIDQTHLDYMINGTKNADHHLGVALVKQLPELLEHPVAVIESATRPGDSVMAIVRGKVNGKQLVAAVRIGGNGRINYEIIDSNHIVSAQGRGNAVTKLLNDALQKELRGEVGVYYWNKNEALPLTVQSGVQFPGGRINDGLIHSIFDAASPVNRNYLEQTETQQFKRWFGRSSVVQADGTPRAVRQGVDATVEVLDGKTALQDGEVVYVKLENPYRAGTAAEVPGRAALEAGGYDGAVYQGGDGGTHYAVLDGTQLKSATDNAGTFDGRNPNLRFSQKADAEWAAYVSEEAQQRYAQDGRFQRWAHRDLAFISAASWDGVHIPADVLMQNPKIREAQRLTERRGSSLDANPPGTNSLVDTRRERMAERLLNAEHGSAVFENGKIKKINGVEQFTGEVEQGRHACIVIGRPAGGKSRVFANPLSNRYKARILDADTVKPWLDGFDDGYGAGYVQDESSLIMEMAFEKAIARGDNVIIPKIGGGSIVDLANRMKSAGYTVDLYYNEVSEETSIMRAASRFAEEGRYLALDYLLTIRNKAKETFTKWAESGIFDYAEWRNNDVGFGEEPKLVWRTGDGGLASVLGDAAELERTVGRNQGDAQRYRRDIPVSGGTEAGDREISGQVTGRKQIDSDTTEAPEEGAFFDALIQDTPRRYSARATTNDGANRQSAEGDHAAPAVSEKVLGNVAKRILQRTGSGYSVARLTDGLKTLLHTDAEQRHETADALARQVLAESRERDDRMYDRTLEARAYFRRGKFRLNETQKAEMAYRYNSYGNYRKSLMGKLNLVNSGGSYLDSVWGEICELFPEYFSPDTSEGDQPQKLKEFLDMAYARPEVNPYEQFHGMEDAAAELADELVETVENIGRRPAPERYLEDGRDAEAWEAYWSEVKAGAKGRPAVQRPATRSERLRRAWELFDNGMTPVQYWRQSREEARQASELRLFDDGRPAADTFDTKTSNLLRGLMLQNGERVGGALPDDELRRVMDITSRAKRRVAAALSLSAPVRVFEDVTGWGGDTAAERAQNVKDGNYLKDTYYEYGNLQAANRELWIAEKTRAVLEAVRGHGAYGVLESAVTQMLGERFVTEEQAEAAVSDGKTMIVEAQEGGVFVLTFGRDGKARLLYSSDGKTTTTYDEDFHDRVRRAAGKRSLRALMPVPKTEAGGLRVERLGGAVSVLTEDGKPVARVENGAHPNMPAVRAALGALQRFYADTYDEIAAVRVENGYAPPGHIEHYFPHQSRVYDGVEGFVEAFMANDLPTGINGMTGTFSPGQPWNANLQQRFGTYTEFDAIRGFNRYVRGAADTIFYTPVIQRLRQLEQALRQQGTDALTAEDAGRNAALVDWVHEQANEWANKKASPDRGWESLLGREGYSVSGMLTSLVSQSSVGGSLSSAASNLIGGLTGMAQVDFKHALREGMRTTWQLLRRFDKRGGGYDGFADQIPFLQRRFSENEDILLTRPEQFRRAGSKALYALFSELDRWAVESVARAKYAECLDDGMTKLQAIAATNDLLIKNFADRGKGQAPRIFNVKWARPFVQFQLEVLNQLHHFRDMDRAEVEKKLYELERRYGQGVPWDELEKKALSSGGPRKLKKVMAYLLLISLWGFLARALLGRDQTWNPLGMAADAVQDFREGGVEQAGAGLLEAVMDNVPFVSVLSGGGRVPLVSNLSNVAKAVESILFDKDFANADLVQAGTSFLPGGGQLRKTIQGAQANAAGGKYTKDGRLQYPIGEDDFWKTLLFGPSAAAPQGYDWTDALTKTETAAYETLVEQGYDPQDLYDTLLGYGGGTNAEKALSLLENRGAWDDGELNMIAELLGLDAGNDLERYAARETERYLSEKRKALAKGQITQQEYDRIEKRLMDQLADVQTGA